MKVRAIAFDKDGTLLDFRATYGPATRDALARLGDVERLGRAIGFDAAAMRFEAHSPVIAGTNAAVHALLMEAGADVTLAELDALFAETSVPHATLLPGAENVLRSLAPPIAVATNDTERGARLQLQRVGIASLFSAIIGYDSGHGSKPEPGMVLACAAALGSRPSEMAFVGDSVTDCRASRAAGAFTVAVTTGEADADTLRPYADAVIRSLDELPALIAQ